MTDIEKINAAKPGREQAEEIVRQCRAELRRNSGQYGRLARLAEGRLTYGWITQFAAGGIDMPKLETILILARFLGVRFVAEEASHFAKFEG